jgi:hypothetical protein
MSPENLVPLAAKRLLRGLFQQALANDEEIGMLGRERGIVDLGALVPALVVGDLRQLPARADQAFGKSRLVENAQRAPVDRQRVTVLVSPLMHVDDLDTHTVLLQKQRRDETDRTGADDEDLRIGVTEHRASPWPLCDERRPETCVLIRMTPDERLSRAGQSLHP